MPSLTASPLTRSVAKTSTEAVIMSAEPSTQERSPPRSIITQEVETQATTSSVETSLSVLVSLIAKIGLRTSSPVEASSLPASPSR